MSGAFYYILIFCKFNQFLEEQLQDDELRQEYENLQPEFDVIKAMVEARISKNLTQQQLADGMDMALKIEFIPKKRLR